MNVTTDATPRDSSARGSGTAIAVLEADEITRFYEQGFLAIQSLIDIDEVKRMRSIYDRLFADRTGWAVGDQFDLGGTDEEDVAPKLPQIHRPSQYAPELLADQTVAKVNAIITQLLGDTAAMTFDHAINKPPLHGVETPWHQDEAYWEPDIEYDSVSIWIPLQQVTVDSGCMHFIPGSHRGEIVAHRPIDGDPRIHGLEVLPGSIDTTTAVACPLPPGGATIHHSKTLHHTPGNKSNDYRRAYIAIGSTPQRPAEKARDFPWRDAERTQTARAKRKSA